jgi:hypothetical protein
VITSAFARDCMLSSARGLTPGHGRVAVLPSYAAPLPVGSSFPYDDVSVAKEGTVLAVRRRHATGVPAKPETMRAAYRIVLRVGEAERAGIHEGVKLDTVALSRYAAGSEHPVQQGVRCPP